jgi:hypothetical protein
LIADILDVNIRDRRRCEMLAQHYTAGELDIMNEDVAVSSIVSILSVAAFQRSIFVLQDFGLVPSSGRTKSHSPLSSSSAAPLGAKASASSIRS